VSLETPNLSTRREFLATCGKVALLGVMFAPVIEGCLPTSTPPIPTGNIDPPPPGADGRIGIDVSDLSDYNPTKVAGSLIGSDGMPVLITRRSSTDYRALSTYCPHAGCQVETTSLQGGDIPCLCHGSLFGLDGSLHQGPATTSLKIYDSIYVGAANQIRIKLS
jgi:Rieske Fe-S protein